MPYEYNTLGSLLDDSRINKVAKDAIRNRHLEAESVWNKTLAELESEHLFSGDIGCGIKRLYAAAETGDWYYPLYSATDGDRLIS